MQLGCVAYNAGGKHQPRKPTAAAVDAETASVAQMSAAHPTETAGGLRTPSQARAAAGRSADPAVLRPPTERQGKCPPSFGRFDISRYHA